MREILFKARRADKYQAWVYGSLVKVGNRRYIIPESVNRIIFMDIKIEVLPQTVSQFTGLLDKNGNKIFEGDVIDINQTVNGVSKFVILSCIGGYDVRYFYDNKPQREYEYSIFELLDIDKDDKEIEIIGNIHENR